MPRSSYSTDGRDRATAAGAAILIHVLLGAAFLTGLALSPTLRPEDHLQTFDVAPPPPPPPIAEPDPALSKDKPAPAGKKAEPSPIVAPPAVLPSPQEVQAAPVAGRGSASSAGSAASGSGTGGGGTGTGSGGGRGIGTEARLLSGNRSRLPRQMLRQFAADRGYAHLLLRIAESGRVEDCRVLTSTGAGEVDRALCAVMVNQSQWSPARDRQGRPITVEVRYTSVWSKD